MNKEEILEYLQTSNDIFFEGKSQDGGIVFVDLINNNDSMKTFIDAQDILFEFCNRNGITEDMRRTYIMNKSTKYEVIIEDIKNHNPSVIVSLGAICTRQIFDLKDSIVNRLVDNKIIKSVYLIPTFGLYKIWSRRTDANVDKLNEAFRLAKFTLEKYNKSKIIIENKRQKVDKNIQKYKTQIQLLEELKKSNPESILQVNSKINEITLLLQNEEQSAALIRLKYQPKNSEIMTEFFGDMEIKATCEIIYSYEQFKKFCEEHIKDTVGFDVETNALPVMDVNHRIIGFSLASDESYGCYVPLKTIEFVMNEYDKQKIEEDLKQILQTKEVWVYNCQHEVPVVYNNYGILLKDIKDLYVMVKLLNCGKSWESGTRKLKYQVSSKLGKNDWSEDLDLYFTLFRGLNKDENQTSMKLLLSKYYSINEIDDILQKVIERYEDLKDSLSSIRVLSYEHVPCKLIGKYGSLDSSSLFLLKEYYENEIEEKNDLLSINLNEGFKLWQKIHIAHIIMEMNGLYFNDKKAQSLNIWIDEQLVTLMRQIVTSELTKNWIRSNFWYEFSRNILMMNYIDDIIDPESLAKVVVGRNAITKDHIKLYKPTLRFLMVIREINKIIQEFNDYIDLEQLKKFNFNDARCFKNENTKECFQFMYDVSKGKKFSKIDIEFVKGEFQIKLNWQNLLIIYYASEFYKEKPELLQIEFDKWLKEKLDNLKTFEDYKQLFNVNSTVKVFREYISDILLSEDIKLAHTYYKLYEFSESSSYQEDLENLKPYPKYQHIEKYMAHYNFMLDFERFMDATKDEEVFSIKRLQEFKNLYNKYVDDDFINSLRFGRTKKPLKNCFDWLILEDSFIDKDTTDITNYNYKLPTLDAGMIEHLTLLYSMLNCNIDDKSTWTKEFEFMFNYKFIKKLIKAKSTYIEGSTGRNNAYYVDKTYYLKEKFPKRLQKYELGNKNNNIYDYDKAIEFELENGSKVAFGYEDKVQLVDGTIKLAKDILPEDDIVLNEYLIDKLEDTIDKED